MKRIFRSTGLAVIPPADGSNAFITKEPISEERKNALVKGKTPDVVKNPDA